ncbi:hypothetical protein D1872_255550 [compost metagenome]
MAMNEILDRLNFSAFHKLLTGRNPKTEANRIARIIRSASSSNLSSAFPTQRRIRASMSRFPSKGSIRFPPASPAIAFIVKSLRRKSSSSPSTNSTRVG